MMGTGKQLLLVSVVLSVLISCSALNRTFTNREYKKDGYRIFSPSAVFVYEHDPLKRTLTLGYGYDEKSYIDTDGNNRVDKITKVEAGEEVTFKRGEEGTEEDFQKADRLWKKRLGFLQVKEVHETWLEKSPSEILREKNRAHLPVE